MYGEVGTRQAVCHNNLGGAIAEQVEQNNRNLPESINLLICL